MDETKVAPLPPGIVPSDSREDLRDLNLYPEKKDKGILLEAPLSTNRKDKDNADLENTPVPLKAIHAWKGSPGDIQEGSIEHKDLEEIEENKMAKVKMDESPFVSHSSTEGQVNRAEPPAVSERKTPKRFMSSIKRLNRVAPFESNPSKTMAMASLQQEAAGDASNMSKPGDASLLDHKLGSSFAEQVLGKVYSNKQAELEVNEPHNSSHVHVDPVVIIKEKPTAQVEDDGPTYSIVIKKKDRKKTKERSTPVASPSSCNVYEAEPTLEVVIGNNNTESSPEPCSPVPEATEKSSTTTPDPLYSTIEEVEGQQEDSTDFPIVPYNSALIKQLRKHDNNKGNVQLISMKGKIGSLSGAEKFPKGSSVNMIDFHYAAASGDKKTLARIISSLPLSQDSIERVMGTENLMYREEIDIEDSEGRTPLMHAVHNNQLVAVKMLVESGANVNRMASDGSSALHQVAFSGSIEMIALLLSLGADGTIRDNEGRTPLHWATNSPTAKAIELMLDKMTGLDIDIRDGALMTPLMWAAYHCRPEHVRTLLERGADSSLRDIDGMSAVQWSIHRHDTRVLQTLINSKSVEYIDNKGKTVMHQAAEQGSANAVSMVKAVKPTSIDAVDMNGRTPLHWATVCENPEVIRALLHHGADASVTDVSGKSPLDYATEKGLHYCALLLTKAEVLGPTDSYHSILTYGTTSAMPGARAINSQEGQLLNIEEIKASLTSEQMQQIQSVCTGMWMKKFTNEGKGATHSRFFWVNPSNTKLCWSPNKDSGTKSTKSDTLVGVRSSASPAIFGRVDFDPLDKHKYAYTIFTSNRVLNIIALSSEDYKAWVNGLQLVVHLGGLTVTRLMSTMKDGYGDTPILIP